MSHRLILRPLPRKPAHGTGWGYSMIKFLFLIVILLTPAAANAEWREAVSDHFIVYGEGDEAWIRNYAEELEMFDRGVRRLRNLPDPQAGVNRVTIYLVPRGDFADIVGSSMVGGFYTARVSGSAAFLPRHGVGIGEQPTLFHEYTHHIYSVAWANIAIPGWMSEGLAEFHASAEFRKDGSMVFGREPSHRGMELRYLDEEEMRRMLTTSTAESGEYIYYSGGWLLTHFLTFDEDRSGELGKYIVALNSGEDLKQAAETAFGSVRSLQTDLARYRRGGNTLPAVVVPQKDLQIGPIRVRALSKGEEAILPVLIRSQAGVKKDAASDVYEKAKAVAALHPDVGLVQRALAEAAYDADDFTASKLAADQAIALNPSLPSAYAYSVRAAMSAAEQNGATPDWSALRRTIVAGLATDANNAELLKLYYDSFAEQGSRIPAIATQYLLRAFQMAPQVDSLRMALGQQLLAENRLEEARAVIRPLAYSVHEDSRVKRARATFEHIEAGNVEAALATMILSDDEIAEENSGES